MRIPVKICVLGEWIPIIYQDYLEAEDGTVCDGYFDTSNCEIRLNSTLPIQRIKQVLIHELTHAIMDITGLSDILTDEQEEAVCKANERSFGNLMSFDTRGRLIRWKNVEDSSQ